MQGGERGVLARCDEDEGVAARLSRRPGSSLAQLVRVVAVGAKGDERTQLSRPRRSAPALARSHTMSRPHASSVDADNAWGPPPALAHPAESFSAADVAEKEALVQSVLALAHLWGLQWADSHPAVHREIIDRQDGLKGAPAHPLLLASSSPEWGNTSVSHLTADGSVACTQLFCSASARSRARQKSSRPRTPRSRPVRPPLPPPLPPSLPDETSCCLADIDNLTRTKCVTLLLCKSPSRGRFADPLLLPCLAALSQPAQVAESIVQLVLSLRLYSHPSCMLYSSWCNSTRLFLLALVTRSSGRAADLVPGLLAERPPVCHLLLSGSIFSPTRSDAAVSSVRDR